MRDRILQIKLRDGSETYYLTNSIMYLVDEFVVEQGGVVKNISTKGRDTNDLYNYLGKMSVWSPVDIDLLKRCRFVGFEGGFRVHPNDKTVNFIGLKDDEFIAMTDNLHFMSPVYRYLILGTVKFGRDYISVCACDRLQIRSDLKFGYLRFTCEDMQGFKSYLAKLHLTVRNDFPELCGVEFRGML